MRRSKFSFLLPLLTALPLGGQAVLDGVMLRYGDVYGLAVRKPDGSILAQRLPWRQLCASWQGIPLVRGFPILLETVVNGIAALNRCAALSASATSAAVGSWAVAGSVALALALAALLFIAAPHLLSQLMAFLGWSGGVTGVSFHLWDGFFKALIFVAYVCLMGAIPQLRGLFAYHGAEHKVVAAWEESACLSPRQCAEFSRLHPRCGTTFVLFVVVTAIGIQAAVVPALLHFWQPGGGLVRQGVAVALKFALLIPISGIAYEIIRFAAGLGDGPLATALRTPGLLLQRLTTREPTEAEISVALVALAEAVGYEASDIIAIESYTHLKDGEAMPEDAPAYREYPCSQN